MNLRSGIAAATVAALPVVLMLVVPAQAHAGTYVVRECQHSAPQNHSHEALATVFPNPGPYAVAAGSSVCSNAVGEYAIKTAPIAAALQGQYGLARFVAPDGTKIIGVQVAARLRSEAGHRARLSMVNSAGVEKVRFGAGTAGPAGFSTYKWPVTAAASGAYQQFTAGLVCDNPGSYCSMGQNGDRSKTDFRNVKLTIRDDVAPTVSLDGGLVAGGWIRGTATLRSAFRDVGGGLRGIVTLVNDQSMAGTSVLPCNLIAGTTEVGQLSPCASSHDDTSSFATSAPPFVDGENQLTVCAVDYGQNPSLGCQTPTIRVDNTPPALAFRSATEGQRPGTDSRKRC